MSGEDGLAERVQEGGGFTSTVVLGMALLMIYSANGRAVGCGDTIPATLQPIALIRGDGLHLDRYEHILMAADESDTYYVSRVRGHLMSHYPQAPGLLALPLYLPQVLILDRVYPGWESKPMPMANLMAKNASAIIAALAGVVIYRLLLGLGLGRGALLATLAATLGTDLWSTASQSLWQHGPASLALALALWLLVRPSPSRPRLLWAGLATAAMVTFRLVDLVFAIPIAIAVARYQGRRLIWFLPGPILLGTTLLAYNLWFFGTIAGGQSLVDSGHRSWVGDIAAGALGTLFSPGRGLFVFCPWAALALAVAPWTLGRLRERPMVRAALWGLALDFVALAVYPMWWAGHSFGPRFWTDAAPLLAILLGCGLERSLTRGRLLRVAFLAAIVVSVGFQAVGAFCSPSSWNRTPVNVDTHPARLWQWRDCELTRCLREGPYPLSWSKLLRKRRPE